MFTVCPKCALRLVVTAADLRVAQGYVRCGRCSSVFNALARLTEERQPGAADATPEAAGTPPEASSSPAPAQVAATAAPPLPPPAEPEDPIPDDALEFNPAKTDVNSVFVQPAPNPQWTAATGSFRALVAANQDAAGGHELPDSQVDVEIDAVFLAAMLRSESTETTSRATPAAVTAPAVASTPVVPAAKAPAAIPAPPVATVPAAKAGPAAAPQHPAPRQAPKRTTASATSAAPAPAAATTLPVPIPAAAKAAPAHRPPAALPAADPTAHLPTPEAGKGREPAPAMPAAETGDEAGGPEPVIATADERPVVVQWLAAHAWPIGAAVAALLLLMQVVNHYRDQLAASGRFNAPLTSLYGALGVRLFPHWDLHAYDVRQLGASADTEGAAVITVRASIKNGAPQPQPLPMLRVTLQDRFGNRIAARDVLPKSYLPVSVPPSSFLAAGQRIDAQLDFADPGTEAVGFEIDACLPARGGVACANDAMLR